MQNNKLIFNTKFCSSESNYFPFRLKRLILEPTFPLRLHLLLSTLVIIF